MGKSILKGGFIFCVGYFTHAAVMRKIIKNMVKERISSKEDI